MSHSRLNPADVTPEALNNLSGVLAASGRAALVDEGGNRVDLPTPLFRHLVRVVQLMADKRTIVLIPQDETFTSQAAANYLGMSRQHLVDLLEKGEIPFHRVGTHRRVDFSDLVAYEKQRDTARRKALDDVMKQVDEAGLYDASYTGDSD